MARTAEQELLACGLAMGVGAIIWSPLAQGFLSGTFRGRVQGDTRLELMGALSAYDNQRCRDVLNAIDMVVEGRAGAVTARRQLRWPVERQL